MLLPFEVRSHRRRLFCPIVRGFLDLTLTWKKKNRRNHHNLSGVVIMLTVMDIVTLRQEGYKNSVYTAIFITPVLFPL